MKPVERAVLLSPEEVKNPDGAALAGFDCVYAGDDFCQDKLPSAAALRRLRLVFKGRIVLAAPVLTDARLADFKALVRLLSGWGKSAGLAVNDVGALSWLASSRSRPAEVALGRVLAADFGNFSASARFRELFGGLVGAAELDDGRELELYCRTGLALNLHLPLRFAAYSRHCYTTGRYNGSCRLACRGGKPVELKPGPLKERLLVSGNVLLRPNEEAYGAKGGLAAILSSEFNVARLVYNSGLAAARLYLARSPGAAL